MIYLLAKYALLFAATGVLCFLLGRWSLRQRFVDVSDTYEALVDARSSEEGFWATLWPRLDELDASIAPKVRHELSTLPEPELDISAIETKLAEIDKRIGDIPTPTEPDFTELTNQLGALQASVNAIPQPPEIDLQPVQKGLSDLQQAVAGIRMPELDLASVEARIGRLEEAVRAIPMPPQVDLEPLQDNLYRLQAGINAIEIPQPNLAPTNQRIGELQQAIQSLALPEAVDLEPVSRHLSDIEQAIGTIRVAEPGLDLSPVSMRLDTIEERLRLLGERLEQPSEPVVEGPTLLDHPSRGPKDDLQRISGVGPALERLLNDNGVFYFWQIAGWDEDDVRFIDDLLQVFRGRIERDRWVAQAAQLQVAA